MLTRARRSDRSTGRTRKAAPRPPRATIDSAATAPGPQREGGRRDVDPSEDTAVYSCTCGMVFEAQVSTSVACPHCGAGQAW
jgi:hypothetical protein